MSDGYPSMTALLGLLAVAGYQNRDKIGEWLGSLGGNAGPAGASAGQAPAGQAPSSLPPGGAGSRPPALESILAGLTGPHSDPNSFLGGAVGNLVDRFKQAGQGDVAQSWVGTGANQPISPPDLERAIGSDTLSTLQQRTGLSRDEILSRLSRDLPQAVDQYTPGGRLMSPA